MKGISMLVAGVTTVVALGASAKPVSQTGEVIHVDDGDTVVLLVPGNQQVHVRLSSIDAPEASHTKKETGRIGQPYAENAKRYLASLVKGQTVDAHCFEQDRYGRSVCELIANGSSVNRQMVEQGWAWANQATNGRYLRDKSLKALESKARGARAGLWAGAHPIPPWEWRSACWKNSRCVE